MKKKVSVLIFAIIILISQLAIAQNNSVVSTKKTFTINNRNATVNAVTVDLNNPNIKLGTVLANDKIGGHEDFSNMIKRKKPIAAINANYFDAYKTLEPIGTIMVDGKLEYLEGSPASMIVTNDGKVNIGEYSIGINGYINGHRENKWNQKTQTMEYNLFKIWYVNNIPKDNTGVYLFTPSRGDKIKLNNGIAIEVKKDKISKITENAKEVNIPKDGYIIYYGDTESFKSYVDKRFKIGNTIELEYDISEIIKEEKALKETKTEATAKQTTLYGSINKQTKNYWSNEKDKMIFNIFNIWYINSKPIDPTGVYLYTPERGETINIKGGHAVVVENGKVSKVEYDIEKIEIPKNGFVIYYGKDAANKEYIKNRFEKDFTIDFYHKDSLKLDTKNIIEKAVKDNAKALEEDISNSIDQNLIENSIKTIISAGPYLVEDGKVIYDQNKNGFKEDKITKNRAQRSAIGISKNNKLILVTGSNLNMLELAEIMVKLGADRAMNLDGGASSALYANGKMITPAGRKLHTVLMVW